MMRRDRNGIYRKQRRNVLIQEGMDVKKQLPGSGKGEYFSGNLTDYGTEYIHDLEYSIWRIAFRDIESGSIFQYRFRHQMWVGRMPASQSGEIRLVLAEDLRISKTHCMIYEEEGRLCLVDLNSRNHTYLNEKRVDQPVFLHNKDVMRIGYTRLEIEFGK